MHKVLLLGGGKIGRMIAKLLSESGDFEVTVADYDQKALDRIAAARGVQTQQIDATDRAQLSAVMADKNSVVSALSYHFNPTIAEVALAEGVSYFDLTEIGRAHV